MNRIKKATLSVAVVAVLAVLTCLLNPATRAWASVEGSYLYNILAIRGPMYIFKSNVGGAQGIVISTGAYSGASSLGVPTAPTGAAQLALLGGYVSGTRPACAAGTEGSVLYDITVHSLAFCDGTSYHKLVTGSGANDSWTSY